MDNTEREDLTDFDLNLGTLGLLPEELEEIYYSNLLGRHNHNHSVEGVSSRTRSRWRRRRTGSSSHEPRNIPLELLVNPSSAAGGGGERRPQIGEGSLGNVSVAEERTAESNKTGKRVAEDLLGSGLDKDDDKEKTDIDEMSFFDCNICLDMASDPVLSVCGHLFCWSCLYQWLHVYSIMKSCPVCQVELSDTNITPIYGRGNNKDDNSKKKLGLCVPPRPKAQRVESFRQSIQRAVSSSFQIEEMIQRIGRRFDVVGRNGRTPLDDRSIALLDSADFIATQILESGRVRRDGYRRNLLLEQSLLEADDNVVNSEAEGGNLLRQPPRPFLRSRLQRAASRTHLPPVVSSAERALSSQSRRNHRSSSPVENLDSLPSPIIPHSVSSESQIIDAEIDLMLTHDPSDTPRPSYRDGSVFRELRTRRLN